MTENSLEGFKSVQLKYKEEAEHGHQILFKPHAVRVMEPSKPADRTLFVANIPPWADTKTIRRIFQPNGGIEEIYFEFQPSAGAPTLPSNRFFPAKSDPYRTGNGFKFAYIVFERPSSIRNCMTRLDTDKVHIASTAEHPLVSGIKKWTQEYNAKLFHVRDILEDVNSFMKTFDESVGKKKEEDEEMGEADEEGWITVTSSSKLQKSKVKKSDDLHKLDKKGRKKKNKTKELKNFYAHQMKDDKINQIKELRAKFEEDKQKIAKMKADRKFRPF